MDQHKIDRIADALFPAPKPATGAKLGVLEGSGVSVNGQAYVKAPRVAGGRPASGQTAITMRVGGSSDRAVIGYGGYYAPRTTPVPPEEP